MKLCSCHMILLWAFDLLLILLACLKVWCFIASINMLHKHTQVSYRRLCPPPAPPPASCILIFRKFFTRTFLFHTPLLLNFRKCSSQDNFKSRQWQKTLSIFLLKFFLTDYLLLSFNFPSHHILVSNWIRK